MSIDQIFSAANTAALVGWIVLILLPRWRVVMTTMQWSLLLGLALLYSVLISVHFFRVEGAGFFTLPQVQAIFSSPPVALAAWVHYLAFDLFVGMWIAKESDQLGISRLVQAPILVATFMFGPFGFLLFHAVRLLPALRSVLKDEAA